MIAASYSTWLEKEFMYIEVKYVLHQKLLLLDAHTVHHSSYETHVMFN